MLVLRAPAKINWLLFVLGKRDDGFHEILSLAQKVDLCDGISFEPSGELVLEADCPIPAGDNLVWKAACLLKTHTGHKGGARIRLVKKIPVEAGLGGGSSDAAAALVGLNRLWGLGLDEKELSALGASLGSDVPFFLGGSAAVMRGRGEVVETAAAGGGLVLLITKPPFGVSTAWAYRAVKKYSELTKAERNIKIFIRALREADGPALVKAGGNDLEEGVFGAHPELGGMKRALITKGALYAGMSGSGSALFGLFPGRGPADSARVGLEGAGWWATVVRTL
jgi:4-diphosphocytidyl-2-C-methyl-D-erythritol kinase